MKTHTILNKRSLFFILSLFVVLVIVVFIFLFFGKTPSENMAQRENVSAKVLEIDDSDLVKSSFARIGAQWLTLEIRSGERKGTIIRGVSRLIGKAEFDTYCHVGDRVNVALFLDDGAIKKALVLSIDRRLTLFVLFSAFAFILILFAASVGVRALFSFAASALILWYVMLPGLTHSISPLPVSFLVVIILSAIILFMIGGWSRKSVAAFMGTVSGLFLALLFTLIFGYLLKLNGMTQPFSEQVLLNNPLINIRQLFFAGILLGASGAAMDVSIDITASLEELHRKRSDLTRRELFASGIRIGRSVIGTMTTTLLLAYAGGYLTLLLNFKTNYAAGGSAFNLQIVSAEILRTLAGSVGLILVAPATAFYASWLYGSSGTATGKLMNRLRLK